MHYFSIVRSSSAPRRSHAVTDVGLAEIPRTATENAWQLIRLSASVCLYLSCLSQMSEKMEQSEKQAEEGLVDEAQALLAEVCRTIQ